MQRRRDIHILAQPDDTTCGPTCLDAVYRYYGDELPLSQVIAETPSLPEGGTLGVYLACHALRRGYTATIYTYNLQMFDPTWFSSPGRDLTELLRAQAEKKRDDAKLVRATVAYEEFFALGGVVAYRGLDHAFLADLLSGGRPLLTGLSATYLYDCARELGREHDFAYDDIAGEAAGHFVLLHDYDPDADTVVVADPLHDNPLEGEPYYQIGVDRLIGAIMLGVVTYDANLLVIEPAREGHHA
ncbi:hypothetical protein [Haliangium sp.]|uniref:hypothetical protein n=1 Tax=Haliangium sp. TaxID=2663208 RepID=UPI003D1021F3